MSKRKSSIGDAIIIDYIPITFPKLSFSNYERIVADTELYKCYPDSKRVFAEVDIILKMFPQKLIQIQSDLIKWKYYIISSYYDVLYQSVNAHDVLILDKEYNDAFSEYFGKLFRVKSIKGYYKIRKRLNIVEINVLLKYNPHLSELDASLSTFFTFIKELLPSLKNANEKHIDEILAKQRAYLPNRKYSRDMRMYYQKLINDGYKEKDAARKTFEQFYTADDLKKIKKLESKYESFIRGGREIKL